MLARSADSQYGRDTHALADVSRFIGLSVWFYGRHGREQVVFVCLESRRRVCFTGDFKIKLSSYSTWSQDASHRIGAYRTSRTSVLPPMIFGCGHVVGWYVGRTNGSSRGLMQLWVINVKFVDLLIFLWPFDWPIVPTPFIREVYFQFRVYHIHCQLSSNHSHCTVDSIYMILLFGLRS